MEQTVMSVEPVSVLRRRQVGSSNTETKADVETTSDVETSSSESELSTEEASPTETESEETEGEETEEEEVEEVEEDGEEEEVEEEDKELLEAGAVGIQCPEDFLNVQLRIGGGFLSVCQTLVMFLSVIVYLWIIAYQLEQLKHCRCD